MLELEPGDGREELGKLDPAPHRRFCRSEAHHGTLFKVNQVLVMFEIKNATTRVLRSMVHEQAIIEEKRQ